MRRRSCCFRSSPDAPNGRGDRDNELAFFRVDHEVPNARLCKAMLDRLTDQAHIIETGNESYRFRRTLDNAEEE